MPRRGGTLTLRRDDGRIVCESVAVADTRWSRLRGLLGRRRLDLDEGLVLRPSFSVHTWFMSFPIDVVFVDADQVVLKIRDNLKPFRTTSCRGAREVVELHAGEAERRGLVVGDRIAWAPRATATQTPSGLPDFAHHQPRGRVLVASSDARFVKLSRFLLEGRGIEVSAVTAPGELVDEAEEAEADVVILDAQDEVATALRTAHATRARRPELSILVVGEHAAERSVPGMKLYDKWDETEDVIDEIERHLAELVQPSAGIRPPGAE
jgi:uncharacterized membrane protein (UPF0127 family)/CheY-like chemotaxis protein